MTHIKCLNSSLKCDSCQQLNDYYNNNNYYYYHIYNDSKLHSKTELNPYLLQLNHFCVNRFLLLLLHDISMKYHTAILFMAPDEFNGQVKYHPCVNFNTLLYSNYIVINEHQTTCLCEFCCVSVLHTKKISHQIFKFKVLI